MMFKAQYLLILEHNYASKSQYAYTVAQLAFWLL
jgi:hypothetical protein